MPYGQLQWTGGGDALGTNNFDALSQWRMFFNGNTAYTLRGNDLRLFDNNNADGGIMNRASATQNIELTVRFADTKGNGAFIVNRMGGSGTGGGGGDLLLSNIVLSNSVGQLRIGGESGTGAVTIRGSITESGGAKSIIIGLDHNTNVVGGLVNFLGDNSYSGGTTLRAGTLRLGHDNALGTGTFTVVEGTSARVLASTSATERTIANNFDLYNSNLTLGQSSGGTGQLTFTGPIRLGNEAGETRDLAVVGTHEFAGVVSGLRNFGKTNSGTLIFSGANTYSGDTFINAGTIMLTNNGSLASSAVRIGASGTFDVRNNTEVRMISERGVSDGGTANIATGATLTIVGDDLSGLQNVVSGGGDLVKSGNGTLTIYGTSSHTGGITVNAGRLTASGALSSQTFNLNGGEFRLAGNNRVSTNDTVVMNMGGGVFRLNTNAQTLNGTMNLAEDTTSTISISGSSDNMTMNGGIAGAGNLIKAGTGTLFLNGNNTYTGTTTLNDGGGIRTTGTMASANYVLNSGTTLTTAGVNRLSSTANLTLNAATLRADSGGETIGGEVTLGSGSSTISVSVNATEGVLINGLVVGSGNLVKEGTGRLLLTGANSYSGTTTISAGELVIDGDQSLATGNVSVASNAILSGSGTIGGATTINGIHNPGSSPGIQSFSADLTYNTGAVVNWELIGNTASGRGTNYDGIDLLGAANLNFAGLTTLNLHFNAAGSSVSWADIFWNADRDWLVYDLNDGIKQNFENLRINTENWLDSLGASFNETRSEAAFTLASVGQDVFLVYTVPEPSTYALLALGALGLAAHAVRRRRRSS